MNNIPFWRNKQVCVTGGAGFIGHHIVQALLAQEARVLVYDTGITGNFNKLTPHPYLNLVRKDVREIDQWAQTNSYCADHIIHLAAVASVSHASQDPDTCFHTNVAGTYAVLRAAQHWGCTVAFASSAAVYGPQSSPCVETMVPDPQSWYARSKLIGELLCHQASAQGVPTLCLRYFNVVGPGQPHTGPSAGVASIWLHHIRHAIPLCVQGDGSQIRDFIPVCDIVRANLLLPQLDRARQQGQPINICTGKGTSLLDLIKQLTKEAGRSEYPIEFLPARPGDIKISVGDCSRYQNMVKLLTSDT